MQKLTDRRLRVLILHKSYDIACGISRHLSSVMRALKDDVTFHVVTGGGDALNELQSMGIEFSVVPQLGHSNRVVTIPKAISSVARLVKTFKPDVLHSTHRAAAGYAAIAAWASSLPHIHSCHSFVKGKWFLGFGADIVVCNSEGLRAYICRVFSVKNTKVIYPLTDLSQLRGNGMKREALRGQLGVNADEFLILCAGRLEEQKGQRILLEAVRGLENDKRRLVVFFAGDGPQKAALMKMATTLGTRVVVIPPTLEMGSLYESSDLVVIPSITESFGLVGYEAGVLGRPVVSTATSGARELFAGDIQGYLAACGDPENLSDRMKPMIESAEERSVRARVHQRHVENTFKFDQTAEMWRNMYASFVRAGTQQ